MMKTLAEMIAVMKAYQEGKAVEVFISGGWRPIAEPSWNWGERDYRVKVSIEEEMFDIYTKAAYPTYGQKWEKSNRQNIVNGLNAVIIAIQKGNSL
jgi:hypothetical protein